MCGLVAKGSLVNGIPDDTQREDGHCETVAAVESISSSKLGDGLVVVLCPRCGVPECWVEDDRCCGDCELLSDFRSHWRSARDTDAKESVD